MAGYIYLLQVSEFVAEDLDVYTICYKKLKYKSLDGTKIMFERVCHNPQLCLNLIIELFKDKYIQANKVGRNFFYGNYRRMIKDIENIIKSFIKDEHLIISIDEYLNDELNNHDKADIFNDNILLYILITTT